MTLLWKLLRRHLSVVQLGGFTLANLVGATIVLTALQLYADLRPILTQPDSFLKGDYLILSKKISTLRTLGLGSSDFTQAELRELETCPSVQGIGAFTPANYRIEGSIRAGGMGMSTLLFFESVPDRFLDIRSEAWTFSPGERTIPIIIPRNYLNLYNYGFAKSQGLPQISEGIFKKVSLNLDLSGNGLSERFTGHIVGLSNRLNTILVPESFLTWSNQRFGSGRPGAPSRVIVETDGSAPEALYDYIAQQGYEIEGDRQDAGTTARFVRLGTGAIVTVGLLISALSFFILLLSIFLLLQRNSRKLENLLLLGYTPARVARPYQLLTAGLNLFVLLVALAATLLIRQGYLPLLETLTEEYHPGGVGLSLAAGAALALILTLLNGAAIRRKVNRLWKRA